MEKTFVRYLHLFRKKNRQAKNYLTDKRLTRMEKNILDSYFLIRRNQNQAVIDSNLVDSVPPSQHILAHKYYVLGLAYNNLGYFTQARNYFLQAAPIFERLDLKQYHYMANYNLFVIAFNQEDEFSMRSLFMFFESQITIQDYKLSSLRALLLYYTHCDMTEKSKTILTELLKLKKEMSESELSSFQVMRFIHAIKEDNTSEALTIIAEIKRDKSYSLTENFNFMKKLTLFLEKSAPIYLTTNDFKHNHLLKSQILVIKFLDEGNIHLAKKEWEKLQYENPKIYHSIFCYAGKKNIFSKCLEKVVVCIEQNVAQIIQSSDDNKNKDKTKDKVDTLYEILQASKGAIPKEDLYQMVWQEELQDKDQLMRLTRAIYRLKTRYKVEIATKRGSYLLMKDNIKKSA